MGWATGPWYSNLKWEYCDGCSSSSAASPDVCTLPAAYEVTGAGTTACSDGTGCTLAVLQAGTVTCAVGTTGDLTGDIVTCTQNGGVAFIGLTACTGSCDAVTACAGGNKEYNFNGASCSALAPFWKQEFNCDTRGSGKLHFDNAHGWTRNVSPGGQ